MGMWHDVLAYYPFACMYGCMYVCMYVCMHACMDVCVYIYIHTHVHAYVCNMSYVGTMRPVLISTPALIFTSSSCAGKISLIGLGRDEKLCCKFCLRLASAVAKVINATLKNVCERPIHLSQMPVTSVFSPCFFSITANMRV